MYEPHAIMNILHMLVDECTELNPWLPIDENTPEYVSIICIENKTEKIENLMRVKDVFYSDGLIEDIMKPTHWMPLPEIPK